MAYKRNKRTSGVTDKADVEGSFSVSDLKNPNINEYVYVPSGGQYESSDLPITLLEMSLFIDSDSFFEHMVT